MVWVHVANSVRSTNPFITRPSADTISPEDTSFPEGRPNVCWLSGIKGVDGSPGNMIDVLQRMGVLCDIQAGMNAGRIGMFSSSFRREGFGLVKENRQ